MPPGEPARINLAFSGFYRGGAFIDESLVHSRIKENSTAKGGFGMIKIFHKKFSIKSSRKSAQDDFEHLEGMKRRFEITTLSSSYF